MKYFIISDIHSNIQALEAVLDYRDAHYPDSELICLGDIIGYGANPHECIERVFDLTNNVIMGNHDSGVAGTTDIHCFNRYAREAIIWTRRVLEEKVINHLKRLPLTMNLPDFTIVHASMSAPARWQYVNSIYKAQEEMESEKTHIVFSGHTHIPAIFVRENSNVRMLDEYSNEIIKHSEQYIINPGSVGQPRDNDPRASAVFFDSESSELKGIRIGYDIVSAQSAIRKAHLPDYLAERLERGL